MGHNHSTESSGVVNTCQNADKFNKTKRSETNATSKRFAKLRELRRSGRAKMAVSSKEIRRRFGLSKSQLDGLLSRFSVPWGILKESSGRYVWSEASAKRLSEHLSKRSGILEGETASVESIGEASVVSTRNTLDDTGLVRALVAVMEKQADEMKRLRFALDDIQSVHRQEMQELKHLQNSRMADLESKISGEMASNSYQQAATLGTLASRIDRRREPSTTIDAIWRYLTTPLRFLLSDRRSLVREPLRKR